jgi:hypothetical protein
VTLLGYVWWGIEYFGEPLPIEFFQLPRTSVTTYDRFEGDFALYILIDSTQPAITIKKILTETTSDCLVSHS